MLSKIWNKYTKVEENKSISNIKTYSAIIEPIVIVITPKDKNEYYFIKEKIEILKIMNKIYEIIEKNNIIYIIMDNNLEMISKIIELITEKLQMFQ